MAQIRNLKDNGGNVFYPLTHERAVKDSNGVTLETKLTELNSRPYDSENPNGMGYLVLEKDKTFAEQVTAANTIYEIRYNFDLNNATVTIPAGCVLKFNGGRLLKGEIVGNLTNILAERKEVFVNVTISGSWNVGKVFSAWFDFDAAPDTDNRLNIKNVAALLSGDCYNELVFDESIWTSIQENESLFNIPSNTVVEFSGFVKLLPTSISRGFVILCDKATNVVIRGAQLEGDVETHTGTQGEFLHGIKLSGANNVLIQNCSCNKFWGDGIDLIDTAEGIDCTNIMIANCICNYNRRQGLSIESGHNIYVCDSEFGHTGQIKYTAPAYAVCIEPWNANSNHLGNITIINCLMLDSKHEEVGIALGNQTDYQIENIRFVNCVTEVINLSASQGVTFIGTKYTRINLLGDIENEYFTDGLFLPHSGHPSDKPALPPNGFLYYDSDNENIQGWFDGSWMFINGNRNNWELNFNRALSVEESIFTEAPARTRQILVSDITLLQSKLYSIKATASVQRNDNLIVRVRDENDNVLVSITLAPGSTAGQNAIRPIATYKHVNITSTVYDSAGGEIKLELTQTD